MRQIDRLLTAITLFLGGVLLLSVGLNFVNAFMRYVVGDSIMWVEEVMVFTLILLVMLGMVVVTARNNHLSIEVFSSIAPPPVQKALRLLTSLVMCLVCGYLALQSSTIVSMMMRLGQTSVAARLPMWIPHSFVLIAMALSSLAGALSFMNEIMGRGPDELKEKEEAC